MTSARANIDPDKYYCVKEAAYLLGVHRSTIWRWVKNRRLECGIRKVNNRKEFLGEELLAVFHYINH